MPRGGARVGAGRKPKQAATAVQSFTPVLVENRTTGSERPPADRAISPIPPEDLPEPQHDFWRRYAGQAVEAGTLTARTVGAFRLLCELDAEKHATKQTINTDGRTYLKVMVDGAGQEHQELKAHPLTGSYRQLAQRVEALMARFGLAPFGKPIDAGRRKPTTANPWAKVAGQ